MARRAPRGGRQLHWPRFTCRLESLGRERYGRQGIYEVVAIDDSLRRMIHQGASEMEMEAHVRQRGTGIREDGCEKILAGQTSIDEVIRLTMED